MKQLNLNDFKIIENDLKNNIIGCRINNISLINSRDFILSLSMVKNERLLISLNHSVPFVSLINTSLSIPTIIGSTNDALRKYVKDAFVVDVSLFNNDRIFKFTLQKANELYEKEQFFIYVECIPQRPNFIVTDDKNIVIYAAHYTSALASRCIVKNLEYSKIESQLKAVEKEALDIKDIKNEANIYFQNSLEVRSKEKFEELFKFLKIRIKSLSKKIKTLENATNDAKNKLNYQEIGSMLLAYSYDKDELNKYIKENNIEYNESFSVGQNAKLYFKRYKKSKRTIEMNAIEIEKANKEIEYLTFVLSSSSFMNEDELLSLSKQYIPHKFKNVKLRKEPSFIGEITVENVKISFGKNSKANNELTFKIASKSDMFLHIKDFHGSHVIIHSSSPSNEVLLTAAEIALLLSHKEDGDVYYAEMKDVKKGSSLGEANLLSYKTITLKNVRESTKQLLLK